MNGSDRARSAPLGAARVLLIVAAGLSGIGWSAATTRHAAWEAVGFFPPDLARQVQKHHDRYDAGIRRGLAAPPAWRAGPPGSVVDALTSQAAHCHDALRRPVPLGDLVEELGVLAVRVLDVNDPLAMCHDDPREVHFAAPYQRYVESIRNRVRLVYYGQNAGVIQGGRLGELVDHAVRRGRELYPFVGADFYRRGTLADWRTLDDRSVAFGVAAISLSRGMSDLANLAAWVWHGGGGIVPTPRPTPQGHVGPTLIVGLGGGFPERDRGSRGAPVIPGGRLALP